MASTYSDLKIELIGTGDQSGTWGATTNTNLGTALEEAIVGRATANFTTDANLTISLSNANTTQVARNYILNVTSGVALTVTRSLIVPTIDKPYIIENNTTGGQSILVKTSAGTGITVPTGKTVMVYANGTNVVQAFDYVPSVTAGAITDSGLTAGRVTYAGTAGLLADSASLTFDGTILSTTTVDATNLEVTNLKAKDGTAAGSIANSTGVVTIASSVLTTTDINGGTIDATAIGGSTPSTVAATTISGTDLTTTGNTILGNASTDTLNVGNGDLIKDSSGNLGLGVTPSAWGSYKTVQISQSSLSANGDTAILSGNAYYNAGWKYIVTDVAAKFSTNIGTGGFIWDTAPSGTAGNAITFTQAMTLDNSGNLGLGVTPSAWASGSKALQITGNIASTTNYFALYANGYYDGVGDKYTTTSTASRYYQLAGEHVWNTAPSGTAGNFITWTQAMTLGASGNLGLGVTPSAWSQGKSIELLTVGNAIWSAGNADMRILSGAYYNSGYKYSTTGNLVSVYIQAAGTHTWYTAPSGTAGNAITLTQAMTLDASGNLSTTGGATIQGLTVGRGAGAVSTNTAVGASALVANTSGAENTALGRLASRDNTTGSYNTSVGSGTLLFLTTGSANTGVGRAALQSATTSTDSTAIGYRAMIATTTGASNTALGSEALQANTTASNNTAVGYQAGYSNTTGALNTFVGKGAGYAATTSGGNVFVGVNAGFTNITGSNCTYVGESTGGLATGTSNTFLGNAAGYQITTGTKNTIIGLYQGNQGGLDIRTASNYIVLSDGDGNPRQIIDSSGNLGLGTTPDAWNTGYKGIQLYDNVGIRLLGANYAGILSCNQYPVSGATYNRQGAAYGSSRYEQFDGGHTWFGNAAGAVGNFTPTERMRLDASGVLNVGTTTIGGVGGFTIRPLGNYCRLYLNSNGTNDVFDFSQNGTQVGRIQIATTQTFYVTTSDYRLKENIAPMVGALEKVALLKPVTYKWKLDGSDGQGFIAHELAEVIPNSVAGEKDATEEQEYEITPAIPAVLDEEGVEVTPAVEAVMGTRTVPVYQGIDTSFLVATLTAAIQELKAELDITKAKVAALEAA